ncbi:hypothetical protein AU375_01294 [Methylobacterium radiotolerans]|nr:hypothetical protein AU375_01294 [Methylobacterium radiotolerans]
MHGQAIYAAVIAGSVEFDCLCHDVSAASRHADVRM